MSQSLYILLTLLVGLCLPIMASSNGMLGKSVGSPFTASFGVFVLASLLMAVIIIVTRKPGLTLTLISGTSWKMWLGGCIVVLNIMTFTVVPEKIGATNMVVLFIAGQIFSSVIAEHFGFLNLPVHPVNGYRMGGIILVISGVILIKFS